MVPLDRALDGLGAADLEEILAAIMGDRDEFQAEVVAAGGVDPELRDRGVAGALREWQTRVALLTAQMGELGEVLNRARHRRQDAARVAAERDRLQAAARRERARTGRTAAGTREQVAAAVAAADVAAVETAPDADTVSMMRTKLAHLGRELERLFTLAAPEPWVAPARPASFGGLRITDASDGSDE